MTSTHIVCYKDDGRLGVSCVNNPNGEGVVVTSLVEDSVASNAGLHVGDVVTTVNGVPVHGHQQCIEEIDAAPNEVSFGLLFGTRFISLDKSKGRIGLTCTRSPIDQGVLVAALDEGSQALANGLLVGDTLLSVNGVVVEDHQHAIDLVDDPSCGFVDLVVTAATHQIVIDKSSAGEPHAKLGLTVADRYDGRHGVVVVGLHPGGLASRQLQLGDHILSVNGKLAISHAHAIELIDNAKGSFVLVLGELWSGRDFMRMQSSHKRSSAAEIVRELGDADGWLALGPADCSPKMQAGGGPFFTRHNDSPLAPSNRSRRASGSWSGSSRWS